MNKSRAFILTLAIFIILACSFTSGSPAAPTAISIPPTTAPDMSAATQQAQDQMATFVAQTVAAQQPAATDTPVPALVEPPTATAALALPNTPANLVGSASCTKVVANSYTVYKFVFVANLTWEDRSGNETAFELLKDGQLLATLDADTTTYKDVLTFTTPYKRPTQIALYTIQAINAAGKSEAVELSVSANCR
jgi:hypothetical protein